MTSHAMPSLPDRPIGVFDSGLGGLTVVGELRRLLPEEPVTYLGDSARVPYGIKSPETIRRFALEDARFLLGFGPKLLIVACNTASAAAIEGIRAIADCEVVDVIRPASEAAIAAAPRRIGVVGTEATVASGAYQRVINDQAPDREVLAVACPLLVPIVEEGRPADDPIVMHVLCDYLAPLQRFRPEALILGCTHYPLLAEPIRKLMGPDVALINSGREAARQAAQCLRDAGLLATEPLSSLNCYTTDNPDRFARLAERFGGRTPDEVHYVGTDELENLPLEAE